MKNDFQLKFRRNVSLAAWFGLAFFGLVLSACGGSGSGPAGVSQDDPLINSTTSLKAQPGDFVTLRAHAEANNGEVAHYRWTQMEGPGVLLADAVDRYAHFVMPPRHVKKYWKLINLKWSRTDLNTPTISDLLLIHRTEAMYVKNGTI